MGKVKKKPRYSKSRKSPMGTAKERHEAMKKMKPVKNALQGNEFWKLRSKHGIDKIFKSPQIMYEALCEAFEFTKSRVWEKVEFKIVNGKLKEVRTPTAVPFTWENTALQMGVTSGYFRSFRHQLKQDDPQREGFTTVIDWADNVIRNQKFEGGAIGAYNANLISYDLGIRKDMPQNGSGAGIIVNVLTDDSKKLINEVIDKLKEIDDQAK